VGGIAIAEKAEPPLRPHVRIVKEPLRQLSEDAFECVCDRGRFLIGIAEGKIVARGTDVGLSDSARDLLDALARRSLEKNLNGALRFIHVEEAEFADDCTQQALSTTDSGDLLFFLVSDRNASEAVKTALDALSTP